MKKTRPFMTVKHTVRHHVPSCSRMLKAGFSQQLNNLKRNTDTFCRSVDPDISGSRVLGKVIIK